MPINDVESRMRWRYLSTPVIMRCWHYHARLLSLPLMPLMPLMLCWLITSHTQSTAIMALLRMGLTAAVTTTTTRRVDDNKRD